MSTETHPTLATTETATATATATATEPDTTAERVAAPPPGPSGPEPSWSLRRRLGRLFLVLLVGFLALGVVAAVAAVQFVQAGNRVIYRYAPATAASQRILADLVNEETGQRGYLLTRQTASLKPYTDYAPREPVDTAEVQRLVGGEGEIRPLFQALVSAANTWRTESAEPTIRAVQQGRTVAVDVVERGQNQFGLIRVRAAALTAKLRDKASAAQDARTRTGVLSASALGLVLLIALATGFALWRGLRRNVLVPIEGLGRQTRAVASGQLATRIAGDGPREIVDLGLDVEGMRTRIVTELARVEGISDDLRRRGVELERSNNDLQQFAYVASHDLSEPLRKVANFCQLLERQYGPQLDDRARQYIHFATDGAKRMQALINDLLALSRVGRTTETFVPLSGEKILDQAVSTLGERIRATGATVERRTALPTLYGDRSLLTSLFENLIGNAIKYHRDDVAPVVRISAEPPAEPGGLWAFTVADNGIGIDPQYAERIFAVFQRLHLRDQYGGTGIGLALCRRIVEFHGGTISLDTERSSDHLTDDGHQGSTFVFTLPEGDPRGQDRQ